MKVVIPGGSGHVGTALARHFVDSGHDVVVLSRGRNQGSSLRTVAWDGRTLGDWTKEIDGADVVINLAGRTVNCRYNTQNLGEMMDSRVLSTRIVGQAISQTTNPPKVWLQSSTATIYADRFDAANDEETGIIGGDEPGAPPKWVASIKIAMAWEAELAAAPTTRTRKVALRSAMTMSVERGSVFDVLAGLARRGLGGRLGDGKQFVSWIHELDFCRAIDFLIANEHLEGPVNVAAPNPLPQAEFASVLRGAVGAKWGLGAPNWLVELGTLAMSTESELALKSRRVVPGRLLDAGFTFEFETWNKAAHELASRLGGRAA